MDKVWTIDRNVTIDPGWWYIWMPYLITLLEAKGWTLIGWGTGGYSSGSHYWDRNGVTTPFSTNQTDCWMCLQGPDNGDGKARPEIVYQIPWSTNSLRMWIRHEGGYTDSGISFKVRPTVGDGDEMGRTSSDYEWPTGTSACKWTFCTADDGSFMAYSYANNRGSSLSCLVALEDLKDGDLYPYASFHRTSYNYQMIDRWQFSYQNGNASIMAYHPTLGSIWGNNGAAGKGYGIAKLYPDGDFSFALDPVNGEPTLVSMPVMSWGNPEGGVKGRMPDMFYSFMVNGDRFENGDYVQIGHCALPWGSPTEVLEP